MDLSSRFGVGGRWRGATMTEATWRKKANPDDAQAIHLAPPPEAAPHPLTLSLVIPVYNEARHLRDWCEQLFKQDFGLRTEMVFVDDCSTDGSREILQEYRDRPGVQL